MKSKKMKIIKNVILLLIVMGLMTPIGCDNASGTQTTEKEEQKNGGKGESLADGEQKIAGEITYAYWGAEKELEIYEAIMDKFKEEYPDVIINNTYTSGADYPTKLQTWFSSNTAPDVMGIANDILSPYVDLNVYEDLKPYTERDGLDEGVWTDIALDVFTKNDELLAIPFQYKLYTIAYNKTMFDDKGVSYPTSDWTEEDLLELVQIFTEGEGLDKIYGLQMNPYATLVRNLYGNSPMYDTEAMTMHAEDNEKFKHAFTYFTDLVVDYKVAPDAETMESIGGGFETGIFAMAFVAPWNIVPFQEMIGDKFEWDIVALPQNTEYGPWHSIIFGDAVTMSVNSGNKETAWEFMKFISTDRWAQEQVAGMGIPMLKEYANSDEYLNDFGGEKPYNKLAFVEMLERTVGWETVGVWGKVNDELVSQMRAVMSGDEDVDSALASIQKRGTEVLEEEKK